MGKKKKRDDEVSSPTSNKHKKVAQPVAKPAASAKITEFYLHTPKKAAKVEKVIPRTGPPDDSLLMDIKNANVKDIR